MCGILGGNNLNWDFEKGIKAISHRGPDGFKIMTSNKLVLAFTRLAIMDLSNKAMQPMVSEDGNVYLLFNGEIYGYNNLKNILRKKYNFETTSDTEVIMKAYLEYGDAFIDKIDGMFAIAIYDKRDNKARLFRDRSGIKPLYYYYDGRCFAFSSEIKGVKEAANDVNWIVDNTALFDFLIYRYIPEPKSIYRHLYKLPPASYLVFNLNNNKIESIGRYWKIKVNSNAQRKRKTEDLDEELRYLINESVKEQIVADVPIGTYLSGGIDSSIITYECNKLLPGIQAFTIGFAEKKYDETEYAVMMVDKYHINCRQEILNKKMIDGIKGNMKKWYDEPFADTSAYPTYIISQIARENVTVVLTGDGGDELFGGYERYKRFEQRFPSYKIDNLKFEQIAEKLVSGKILPGFFYEKYCLSHLSVYARILGIQASDKYQVFLKKLDLPNDYDYLWYLKKYYNPDLPPITRMRYLDYKTYLPSDILTKVDRTSMAVSLETRVPFLNQKVIEFAFSLSDEECCGQGCLKGVLKSAYRGIIPEEILHRKKRGFSIPPIYLQKERRNRLLFEGILKNEWTELWKILDEA